MYMLLVPVVMVAIGVIITLVGIKRANEEQKKKDAEKAMNLLDGKDEFKKFLDYDNSSKPANRPQQVSMSQPQRPAQSQTTSYRSQPTQQTAKQQMTAELQQRLVELKRMQAERNAAKSNVVVGNAHHNDHCDVSHKDTDKYRVEYVPTMNSIGGKSTEGCDEHYNVRYVKLNEEEVNELELTPLQKAIVYGEVINHPAFKRGCRNDGRLR